MKGAAHGMRLKVAERFDRVDGDFLVGEQSGLLGFEGGGFEFAVDGDERVLVETGITFEAWFRVLVAAEDIEIVLEKAETEFETGHRVVALQSVSLALGEFDEGSVVLTSLRPCLGEMVSIDLEEAVVLRGTADDDMFAETATFGGRVHGSP